MQFLIPICVIIVCYVNISISSMRGLKNSPQPESNSTHEESTRRKGSRFSLLRSSLLHSNKRNRSKSTPTDEVATNTLDSIQNPSYMYNKRPTITFSTTGTQGQTGQTSEITIIRRHCSKTFNTTQKFKTIKLTLAVIILYIICSTPYFVGLIMLTILQPSDFDSKFLSKRFQNFPKFYILFIIFILKDMEWFSVVYFFN